MRYPFSASPSSSGNAHARMPRARPRRRTDVSLRLSDSVAAADIGMRATGENRVGRQYIAGLVDRPRAQLAVERAEILVGFPEQFVERGNDEIGFLEIVDAVFRAHDALQIEADAVRRWALHRIDRLRAGRDDAGPVNAQAFGAVDETEFDRIPIEPREILEAIEFAECPPAALAISLHVVGGD